MLLPMEAPPTARLYDSTKVTFSAVVKYPTQMVPPADVPTPRICGQSTGTPGMLG